MPADVLVDLGTAMAIIGVMIGLFLRADSRIDKLDAKFESRFDRMDAKFESRFGKVDERFDKVDERFEKMDAKFESRFDRMDAKFDAMAQDIVDVKVSVARIEGYLHARDGFAPAVRDRPASQPDVDQPPAGYRQTG